MTLIRYYYADARNQPVGPFAMEDLEKMNSAGVIDPDTQVCPEGGDDWVPLSSLISAPLPTPPVEATPQRPAKLAGGQTKIEKNARSAAAAAVIFPVIMIILTLAVAANPIVFAFHRAEGTGFLHFLLIFAIGLFGPVNAIKLLRIPGIAGRRPTSVVFAWTGIALFVLALGLLLLVGFSLEAEMARRTG